MRVFFILTLNVMLNLWMNIGSAMPNDDKSSRKEEIRAKLDEAQKKRDREYSLDLYNAAMEAQQSGDYDEAMKLLSRFLEEYKGDQKYKDRASQDLETVFWAKQNRNQSAIVIHLGTDVNSKFADYNPFMDATNALCFSSCGDKDNGNLSRFFSLENDSTKRKELPWRVWNYRVLYPQKDVGNGAFNSKFDEFYYTVCDRYPNVSCIVYGSYLDSTGSWSFPKKVPVVNSDSSTTNPTITKFGGQEYMLFSSNRSGGKGGFDIFKAKKTGKGVFEQPQNIGAINTMGDEMSPFYDIDSNLLYFASDYWRGFGGLDIFSVPITTGGKIDTPVNPKNLGYGFNSEAHDYGYMLSNNYDKAYFCSNRKGALYIKERLCCFDIWSCNTDRLLNPQRVAENPADSIAIVENNKVAKPLVDLMPVAVYFKNDQPRICCNGGTDSSDKNYETLYQDYYGQLAGYEQAYLGNKNPSVREKIENDVWTVFRNKVVSGMEKLDLFKGRLAEVLGQGKKVTVELKGYASPLGQAGYNNLLSLRRIIAVENSLRQYQNGLFNDYLANGSLTIVESVFGSRTAPPAVSRDPNDKQESIYSPEASIERRVEVVSIIVEDMK